MPSVYNNFAATYGYLDSSNDKYAVYDVNLPNDIAVCASDHVQLS